LLAFYWFGIASKTDLDFYWMGGFANCMPTKGENDQNNANFYLRVAGSKPINFHHWAIMFTCDLLWLTNEAVILLVVNGYSHLLAEIKLFQ
jgi:hypothetical protein